MATKGKRNTLLVRLNSGFTLIELLVVVAIISVLMAIMLPSLNKVRALANLMLCKSNLRHIATAWHIYLDDNKGRFYQGINANALYGGWKGSFFPLEPRPLNEYVSLAPIPQSKNEAKLFRCPSDDGRSGLQAYESIGTSYQTNILLVGQDQIGSLYSTTFRNEINKRLKGIKLTSVSGVDRLVLIGDYMWGIQWLPGLIPGASWHRRCCQFNVAFMDCHVELLKVRKGLIVADNYTVLPFRGLYELAIDVQVEQPCALCE